VSSLYFFLSIGVVSSGIFHWTSSIVRKRPYSWIFRTSYIEILIPIGFSSKPIRLKVTGI